MANIDFTNISLPGDTNNYFVKDTAARQQAANAATTASNAAQAAAEAMEAVESTAFDATFITESETIQFTKGVQ